MQSSGQDRRPTCRKELRERWRSYRFSLLRLGRNRCAGNKLAQVVAYTTVPEINLLLRDAVALQGGENGGRARRDLGLEAPEQLAPAGLQADRLAHAVKRRLQVARLRRRQAGPEQEL